MISDGEKKLKTNEILLNEIIKDYNQKNISGAIEKLKKNEYNTDFSSSDDSTDVLLKSILIYLLNKLSVQHAHLYDDDKPFQLFIQGGGNVLLYENVISFIASKWKQMINDFPEDQLSVADIGTGSGEVIFPAIEKVGCPIEITTVEPSLAFHSKLVSTFEQLKSQSKIADVHCFNNKAQNLWEEKSLLKDISEKKFDIIQATFSIQNLSKAEDRKSFFLWAKQHLNTKAQLSLSSASPSAPQKTGQLIVIEFDVPESGSNQLPLCRSDRVNFFREAYEKGIGEYRNTPAFMPVTQGFLIPVLLSKFDEDILKDSIETESTSIEQSKEKWAQEMREAGFSRVETCYLAPFWWSNCVAIIGTV